MDTSFFRLFDKSWPVGRLFGIPIRLHITIILFLLPAFRGGWGLAHGAELGLGLVLSILIHELGHALTAKRYKLTGLSITLHGFGGFATSSGYRNPKQDLMVTLAGPAATFAIGLLLFGIGRLVTAPYESELGIQLDVIRALGSINILLGFLNLFPCLPWDGGRALRAILTFRIPAFKATRAVAHLGLILAPLLFIYGYVSDAGFVTLFCIVGFITSLTTLLNSGGVRFGEVFADRRQRKEAVATKKREQEKTAAYLDDVQLRTKEREERERLRRILEASLDDE